MINNNNSATLLYEDDNHYDIIDPTVLDSNFESVLSTYLVNYSDRTNTTVVSNYFIDELHAFYTSYLDTMVLIEDIDNSNSSDTEDVKYTDKNLTDNGFIKSTFVIHEHDSRKAPLHWDFRFKTEFKTSAYSFVIVRHKMPASDEKLLCKKQAMHPPVWVDLDHTDIASGYGAGSVKTIDRGTIYYKELPNSNNKKVNNFVFYLDGKKYSGAYFLIAINEYNYLFFRATSNILPTTEERNKEWYTYASRYIEYLNNRITKTLLSTSKNCNRIKYAPYNYISKNYPIDYQRSINNNNHLLVVPSLQYILDTIDDVDSIVSKDCNINSNEDLMRLFLTREYIRKCILYDLTNEVRDTLIHTTSNINYSDLELLHSYKDNLLEKTIRAISDIYMGHKFYGSVDLENLLAYAIKNIYKGS